ncbi:MAG TPA: bacillithiol biosynthesis deacetylase BshB1 [Ignavibacteria bacterium]|nr:bacillithiol biosynthesis deacetylase BshB1 [Ignavibacteria bacterium]
MKKNSIKLDALFFGAHPDDVELTCGGTVLKLVASGNKVGIIDLTKGELSTRGNLQSRKKETEAATKLLGIDVRENAGLRDGNIKIDESSKKVIINLIRKYQPEIIFAPYPDDRHPDHIHTGNLIRESFFYSGLKKIKTGVNNAYRAKKLYYYPQHREIPVSFVIDISEYYQKKSKVLKCYGTQFFTGKKSGDADTYISTENFMKYVESKARYYGFKIGVEYGEPFYTDEFIKFETENLF